MRDKGNTVLVVEHKPEVIEIADHIIDLGPGAGGAGGEVVYEGDLDGLRTSGTLTGNHLTSHQPLKTEVRTATGHLSVQNATLHNLQDVSVDIPRGVLTVVTGVAGSGKSSLIRGVLPKRFPEIVVVDQAATRGSRRSNSATYTGMLDTIRKLFAKANGVKPALFSANSEGACPECGGLGIIYTDLGNFEPMKSTCELCGGRRYTEEVLGYTLRGQSIADVLEMSVVEAREFFTERTEKSSPPPWAPMDDVGHRLPDPRPTAVHPVRRRAPAAQAGHRAGVTGRRLRAGRADDRPAHVRRRPPDRPASTGSSTPAPPSSSSSTTWT